MTRPDPSAERGHLLGFVIVGLCSAAVSSVATILILAFMPRLS